MNAKADILARLQREILPLQGFKTKASSGIDAIGLDRINQSFPNGIFPFAAVHEFFFANPEEATASCAFITGLLSSLMRNNGAALWISASQHIFPPALHFFGVSPDRFIFLHPKKVNEIPWAVEEALKCKTLTAVVGEVQGMGFTESRRYQLAIEQSGVGCFVLRHQPKNPASAAVTHWQIKPRHSGTEEGLPGVGHPCWRVNLLRVRNGKPGSWDIEWTNGRFRHLSKLAAIPELLQTKTG